MFKRLSMLLALVVVLLSVVPARAEVEDLTAIFDEGEYTVPTLVDQAEYDKIAQLQDTIIPFTSGPVSPDDMTVIVDNYRYSPSGSGFMNILDGSVVPLQPLELGEDDLFFPVGATEVVWLDNDTVGQLLFDLFSGGMWWLTFDRNTGMPSLNPAFFSESDVYLPLTIAPNASRVLVARIPFDDLAFAQQTKNFELPFSQPWPEVNYKAPDMNKDVRSAFYTHTDQKRALNEHEVELGVIDVSTGEYSSVISVGEDTTLIDYAWSKDGSKFALIRDTGEYLRGGAGMRLVDAITIDSLGEYTPSDNPFFKHNVVDTFDFGTGDYRFEALRAIDGDGSIIQGIDWSTDGQRFMTWNLYPAQIAGRNHPTYVFPDRGAFKFYDAQGNYLSMLNAGPATTPSTLVAPRFIAPDEIMFNAIEGMNTALYYYNLGSGELRKVSIWDGTNYNFVTTNFSRHVIYTYSSFFNAPEVYRIQWDGQALARLTWNNAEQESLNNIQVNSVSFTLRNGAVRNGYLIQPAGAAFPPQDSNIVVWQEGGPRAEFVNRWATNVENPYNLLPNLGQSLLFVPLPGRLGFGPEFLNALADNRNFGQIDIDEMAEIVEQLVNKGWTSEDKIGITGCSYGGYFAAQSVTRHPTRYAAANPQCTLLENHEEYHFSLGALMTYLEGVKPTDDPAEYAADSPISRASAARTPTLLFHGNFDFLQYKLAIDFHDQMVIQGYVAKMLLFYDGHGLSFIENQLRAAQEQLIWFRTHLGDGTLIPRFVEEGGADMASLGEVEVVAAPVEAKSSEALIFNLVNFLQQALSDF